MDLSFIEILKVIFLGIVEGITEWLPISSTGHMILVDEFLKLNVSEEFMSLFLYVIQLGAILAVVTLYFNKLWPFSTKEKNYIKKDTWILWFKIVVACLPGMIIGIPFGDKIDEVFQNAPTVVTTLILYGIVFIVMEKKNVGRVPKITSLQDITYQTAFYIGLFQVLAVIPGTSRSGATIIGAMLIGTSRYVAAEFTFFLAVPVMFGKSFLEILKFGLTFTSAELVIIIVGMVVAYVVSILAIKFLVGYIKKNDFTVFGWYRIILGIIVGGYFLLAR